MSEYKYIDSNNIKKVLFILENCDSITVPIENFSFIELRKFNRELGIDFFELNCRIIKYDNIEYKGAYKNLTVVERFKLYNDITACVLSLKDNTIIKCPLIWKQHEGTDNKFQKTEVINNHDLKITVNAQNLVDLKRGQSEDCLNKFLEINNNGCEYCSYVNKCSELLDNCNITLCGYIENILK